MTKKIMSLVLSLVMVLSFIPIMAFADGETPYTTGLNDNALYLAKIPSQSEDYNIVTENGENFIKLEDIAKSGYKDTAISTTEFTFGTDSGLPEDYPLVDDADASKLWVAIRIKIKDNNPAYSGLNASVRMYIDTPSTHNNILAPTVTKAFRWLDLNDGSMTWAYPWSGSYISTANYTEFEFTGDMDGYLLVPLKHNSFSVATIKKFGGFSFRFYNGTAGTSKTIKNSSWANKEFLVGDCFLVSEGTTEHDLSAFQSAHTQGIKKYAPNNYEDTAYYSLRIGGYRTLFYNAFAKSVSRNWYNTGVRTDSRPVAHITTLSNGDRAFEFIVNEGLDYTTDPIDIPAADTYENYKKYATTIENMRVQAGKGVPDEIDLTNLRTLAFRVATKDGSVENETIKFSYGVGTSSTPYRLSANASVTYYDINKKITTTMTADADGNLTVSGNLDGYIIIPIDSFSTELTAEVIKAGWNYHGNTSTSANELYLVSGFGNGKAFYYGDVYFVENVDTFLDYHGIIKCLHENTTVVGKSDADCENAGHTGATVCTECETVLDEGKVIDALGHSEKEGAGKDATCTEAGYESSVACDRCKEFLRFEGEIPAIPHKFAEEGTVVAPTENVSGYTEYVCEYGCTVTFKDTFVMPLSSKVAGVTAVQVTDTKNLRITWEALDGADRYLVYVYDSEGKQIRGATIENGDRTTVLIGNMAEGVYTVKVLARVGGKYTANNDVVEATIGSILPEPPVVTVVATDKESLTVTWKAVEGAQKYFVEFVGGGQRFSPDATGNVLTITGLKVDTEYKISVNVKYSDAVYTGFGEAVTAKTDAHADIELTAEQTDEGILVSWDAISENDTADKYWVKRVDAEGNVTQIAVTEGDETSILAKNIEGANTFYVIARVKDRHDIYRYVKSETVVARDPSLLTYDPVDTTGMTDAQKAVVLTAENYVLRGNRIQYEDTRINATTSRDQWRWGYIKTNTPESYTSQNNRYSNCAAWTHEAYWNALDLDIEQFQTASLVDLLPGQDARVVFRKLSANGDFDTEEKRLALAGEVKSILQPGDLVVYIRDSGTGHVMMYVGNNMMIHCTGSSYDWTNNAEKFETNGAILYESCDQWFEEGNNRYLFDKKRTAIIRPLNTFTGTIPQKTLERMENMRGVVAEKLASVDPNVTVNLGEEITFTVKFSNYSDAQKTFTVTDIVPENTTYVSGAQNVDGNNLSWTVTVEAGKTAEVSYTVKVSEDESALGKTVFGSDTKVGSIALTCHKIYIKNTLTEAEQQSILDAAESLKTSELRDIALADAIYKEAMDSSILENATAADVMNGVFKNYAGTSAWPSRWQQRETVSNTFLNMLAPNLYGGRQVIDPDGKVNSGQGIERTRLVTADNLVIGDIILTNKPETETYTNTEYTFFPVTYMFLGDKLLDMTNMQEVDLEPKLEQLLCERHFAIIRPSIEM